MKFRNGLVLSGVAIAITASLAYSPVSVADASADAAQAGAAGTPGPSGPKKETAELEEVIVTAEKRSENLEKAPAAITYFSGEDLVTLGIQDIRQAEIMVQSANLDSEGSNSQLYIRGIGSFLDTASITPLVTTMIDGMAEPREATAAPLFDVSRVEVLPGPQGTLYGRSGAGGIVSIVNNRPTLGKDDASTTLELGSYQTVHTTTALNASLSDDFAVRLATDFIHHDGYQTSGGDFEDTGSARLSAVFRPDDRLSMYGWLQYQHILGGQNLIQVPYLHGNAWNDLNAQNNPQYNPITGSGLPRLSVPVLDGGGEVDYRFDNFTLSYIPTGFAAFQEQTQAQGTEALDGVFTSGNWSDRHAYIHSYSQELKAVSSDDSSLKWVAGLYWYHQHYSYLFIFNGYHAFDDPATNENGYVAYGQATYPILNWLRLTGGGRFQIMNKEALGYTPDPLTGGTTRGAPFTFDHTWHPLTWKAGVEADITDKVLSYVTVQSDWGAGTFNETQSTPALSNYVEPSRLVSYTGGIKGRFLDNRLQINSELYFYNYKDLIIQSFNNVIGVGGLFSVPLVQISGAELSAKYLLTSEDEFSAAVGAVHAQYKSFVIGTANYNGLGLQQTPNLTATLGYKHDWKIGGAGARLQASAVSHYVSNYWLTYDHEPGSNQQPFTTTDLNLTYFSANGRWNAGLFVKNAENTAVDFTAGGGLLDGKPYVDGYIGPPRVIGLRMSFSTDGF